MLFSPKSNKNSNLALTAILTSKRVASLDKIYLRIVKAMVGLYLCTCLLLMFCVSTYDSNS